MGEHGDSSGDAVCRRPRDSIAGDLRVHTAIRVPTKLDQM